MQVHRVRVCNCTLLLFTWQPEPPLALLNKVRVQEIFLEIKAVSVSFCFSLLERFQKPVGSTQSLAVFLAHN